MTPSGPGLQEPALQELASWSDERTRVGAVLDALERLRRDARGSVRTSVLNLVVVVRHDAELPRALQAVRELGARHPARAVVLVVAPEADPPGIDAAVAVLGSQGDGRLASCEEVVLRVRGPVSAHLDSLIEPFTLPDVPLAVWFADAAPSVGDPLADLADMVLFDSRDLGAAHGFAAVDTLLERRPVIDLSWIRLSPWRLLLGGLFESVDTRPFLAAVGEVEVRGKLGPRLLLAGWVMDRLRLPLTAFSLEAAEHAALSLSARHGEREGVFAVERVGDERLLRGRTEVAGAPPREVTVPLPPAAPGWGLVESLSRLVRDPVYEAALRRALLLAARG